MRGVDGAVGIDRTGNAHRNLGAGKGREMGGLEKELWARLDWYASRVGSEEYDAKAVESILYLLDGVAPLAEGMVPPVDEAWGRFQEILSSRGEMLPLQREELGVAEAAEAETTGMEKADAEAVAVSGKVRKFRARHKGIAAAVLAVLVLAVGGGVQAGAGRNDGFFFWLKEDEGEKQMLTFPVHLKPEMELKTQFYFSEDDMPDWTQKWLEMVEKFEMSEKYEWKCYETSELENIRMIMSQYLDSTTNRIIAIGEEFYLEKTSYNYDRYANYDYVQEYGMDGKQISVYRRTDELGQIFYAIYSYGNDCRYFVEGGNDLEEIKKLMEIYLSLVEK